VGRLFNVETGISFGSTAFVKHVTDTLNTLLYVDINVKLARCAVCCAQIRQRLMLWHRL